jgi:hypothetical protein
MRTNGGARAVRNLIIAVATLIGVLLVAAGAVSRVTF